jgi:hypothetical protein
MAAGLAAVAALAAPHRRAGGRHARRRPREGEGLHRHDHGDRRVLRLDGGKATLKGSLGRFGKIDARVSAGRKAAGTGPAGCTGKPGSASKGKLTGGTKLGRPRCAWTPPRRLPPASVMHMITASTGASGLNAAPDLSSASAPATGPFLTGQLAFAGEPMGTMTTGAISGAYAARFDSIGTQRLPEGNDAMLMRR